MSRKAKPDAKVQEELPEWERPITVTILEEKKPKRRSSAPEQTEPPDGWPKVPKTYRETPESFAKYFVPYRDMNRDSDDKIGLRRVAAQHGWDEDELRYAEGLSPKFRYVDRVAAMKAADREKKRIARQRVKTKREDTNLHRQEELLDESFSVGKQLIDRGRQMLSFPLVRTSVKNGGKVTIFEPAGWKHSDIPSIIKTGKELMELGSEYQRAEVTVRTSPTEATTPATATPAVVASSSSDGGAHDDGPLGSRLSSPREVIDRVLVRFPSWMLEQALAKRKEIEGHVEQSNYQPTIEPGASDGGEAP